MANDLGELGRQVFANIGNIQRVWFEKFGKNFYESWENTNEAMNSVVDIARDTLAANKGIAIGENDKDVHATLLLRDPISDRLILRYSTNQDLNPGNPDDKFDGYFPKGKSNNYDYSTSKCYYQLYDRLTTIKNRTGDNARNDRGLTGWVAVTGISLRINNVKNADTLEGKFCEDANFHHQCEKYGYPKWSSRVSEFLKESESLPRRYMAVPIRSLIDSEKPIGVLRFVANSKFPELSQFDLVFMEGIANILSALINISNVKIISFREEKLINKINEFERTGDFSNFLNFIAESLRSRISSLYIYLNTERGRILRLLDAYGISGLTGQLRDHINDYTESKGGLTYFILNQNGDPVIHKSAVEANGWKGINTHLFYKGVLEQLGILYTKENESEFQQIISNYKIKLMGCSLRAGATPYGVLKVEFPDTFDDKNHYKGNDILFFQKCAEILTKELIEYKEFIESESMEVSPEKFTRYMINIRRFKLLRRDEDGFSKFWKNAEQFTFQYKDAIRDATLNLSERLPNCDLPRLHSEWNSLNKTIESERGGLNKILESRWFELFIDKIIDVLINMYL